VVSAKTGSGLRGSDALLEPWQQWRISSTLAEIIRRSREMQLLSSNDLPYQVLNTSDKFVSKSPR
jgi:hypothetical protein